MRPWIRYSKIAPDGFRAVLGLENYVKQCGLEPSLLELVRLRASQINGCAYCIDIHSTDARSKGETEQRLYCLSAWRDTSFYSDRERAALAWTEAVTKISENQVPDDVYEQAGKQFTEKELVDLTLAVVSINSFNRLAISFNTPAGSYHPASKVTVQESPVQMGV